MYTVARTVILYLSATQLKKNKKQTKLEGQTHAHAGFNYYHQCTMMSQHNRNYTQIPQEMPDNNSQNKQYKQFNMWHPSAIAAGLVTNVTQIKA